MGYVYLLGNRAMPWYYKIGCTKGAPEDRAKALSSQPGVPRQFQVLLYISIEDYLWEEQRLHAHLGDFRPSYSREFFIFAPKHMPWLRAVFKHHPRAIEFTEVNWWKFAAAEDAEHQDPWVVDPDAEDLMLLDLTPFPPIEESEMEMGWRW